MNLLNQIFLVVHIVSGYLALMSGTYQMMGKKGGPKHRTFGKIFYYNMLTAGFSAIYLAVAHGRTFLLYIAIFVLYQTFAGFRSVRRKDLAPRISDVSVLMVSLVNGIIMAWSLNPVLIVFGGITLFLVCLDIRIYYNYFLKKPFPALAWKTRHISMMVGSYIGSLTAFLVVNVQIFNPGWLLWIMPTIVMVPVMQYWTWKYVRRFSSKKLGE